MFTCAHCPTAQAYQDRIKKLVTDYSPRGVTLIAINPNHEQSVRLDELAYTDLSDSFAEMQERARREKFNFVWLDDGPKQELSNKMGPVATPHVFIFDKARKLRFEGRIDNSERESTATTHDTRAALDALLAGSTPAITTTKVFGCSVKWADKVADYANYKKKWAAEPVALEKADAATLRAIRENKDALLEPAKQAAQEIGDQLKPAAQQAVESVKATAQDAATTVTEEGKAAADDVKAQAQQSKETVQTQAPTS